MHNKASSNASHGSKLSVLGCRGTNFEPLNSVETTKWRQIVKLFNCMVSHDRVWYFIIFILLLKGWSKLTLLLDWGKIEQVALGGSVLQYQCRHSCAKKKKLFYFRWLKLVVRLFYVVEKFMKIGWLEKIRRWHHTRVLCIVEALVHPWKWRKS